MNSRRSDVSLIVRNGLNGANNVYLVQIGFYKFTEGLCSSIGWPRSGKVRQEAAPRSKYRSGTSAGRLGDDLSRSCWQKFALSRSDSLIPEGTSRRRAMRQWTCRHYAARYLSIWMKLRCPTTCDIGTLLSASYRYPLSWLVIHHSPDAVDSKRDNICRSPGSKSNWKGILEEGENCDWTRLNCHFAKSKLELSLGKKN